MRKYLAIANNSLQSGLAYSFHIFAMFIGNIFFIGLTYFLWKAVYAGSEELNGMTFEQIFVYMTVSISISILFESGVDEELSAQIIEGDIMMELLKPYDLMLKLLAGELGGLMIGFPLVTLPTLGFVFYWFGDVITFGWNIPFFGLALVFAFLLAFTFDYLVGLTAFYTESLWGITMTKATLVSVLSGMLIPLAWFPDSVRFLLDWAPFQAMFHTPVTILTDPALGVMDYVGMIGLQIVWVAIFFGLSKLYYQRAIRKVTINGG